MTYIAKPKLHHPSLVKNKAGYTRRDYEGAVSTLCAGCGHDSISAAIIQSCFELDLPPHRIATRGVCLVPEHRGIFKLLTVEENLLLGQRRDSPWRRHAYWSCGAGSSAGANP